MIYVVIKENKVVAASDSITFDNEGNAIGDNIFVKAPCRIKITDKMPVINNEDEFEIDQDEFNLNIDYRLSVLEIGG